MADSLQAFDDTASSSSLDGGGPIYDVIIVGAGVAGGVYANCLAPYGLRILMLEKGKQFTRHRTDFVENEMAMWERTWPNQQYEVNGNAFTGAPNFGQGVGGGSLVWTAVSLRFMAHDFRMRSLFGPLAGANLADWPLDLTELTPFYEQAEQELGVSGAPMPWPGQRNKAYPFPAFDLYRSSERMRQGLDRLGMRCSHGPVAITSRNTTVRNACLHCGFCRSSCRIDAKFQADHVLISPLVKAGRVALRTNTEVLRITQNARANVASGVEYIDTTTGARQQARGRLILVCNNPIETPRLFLNSANRFNPKGLGNGRDLVGRNLYAHIGVVGTGVVGDCLNTGIGYNMGNLVAMDKAYPQPGQGYVGGFVLESLNGAGAGVLAVDPYRHLWGKALKDAMRNYDESLFAVAFGEGVPVLSNRVRLSSKLKDNWGQPQGAIDYTWHDNDLKVYNAARQTMTDVFRAAGATTIGTNPDPFEAHLAGTMRMGLDEAASVVNPFGRVHGLENVYVGGASQFVTGSSVNPTLTVYALALRTARHLQRRFGLTRTT